MPEYRKAVEPQPPVVTPAFPARDEQGTRTIGPVTAATAGAEPRCGDLPTGRFGLQRLAQTTGDASA